MNKWSQTNDSAEKRLIKVGGSTITLCCSLSPIKSQKYEITDFNVLACKQAAKATVEVIQSLENLHSVQWKSHFTK